jgi:hypothetical protein
MSCCHVTMPKMAISLSASAELTGSVASLAQGQSPGAHPGQRRVGFPRARLVRTAMVGTASGQSRGQTARLGRRRLPPQQSLRKALPTEPRSPFGPLPNVRQNCKRITLRPQTGVQPVQPLLHAVTMADPPGVTLTQQPPRHSPPCDPCEKCGIVRRIPRLSRPRPGSYCLRGRRRAS